MPAGVTWRSGQPLKSRDVLRKNGEKNMDKTKQSTPLNIRDITITDEFFSQKMELVRKEVLPYQWNALNDRIPEAAKSYCMRNFKVAGHMNETRRSLGEKYIAPTYTFRGFESLPEDPENPDPDKFYGFVFQDTDFSKWIEAVGYSLSNHPDPELEKTADEAIDIVCAAQQEDGYLDTYYIINGRDKSFTNLRDHHELYCFGHLVEGAVAYYEGTGKDKLLKAAERFADYIDSVFGPEEGKLKGYPGHEIAEMALVRLYHATGNEKYLNLSSYFIEERGKEPLYFKNEFPEDYERDIKNGREPFAYNQAHRPVRKQDKATGHAVRAVYLYSGMADIAREFNDDSLKEACETLWENVTNSQMYITGGVGATHLGEAFTFDYDLPNDTAYAETCASIGMIFWARRMLQMDPDSRYANVMEREFYNGMLSGIALDGKSFFYVNPLEVDPVSCHKDERKFHVKPIRQKWFGCACCPPNIARLLSSFNQYAFTENEDTLFVHMYSGADITKHVNGSDVKIHIDSCLPYEGHVSIRVSAPKVRMKLAVRLPDWTDEPKIDLPKGSNIKREKGYLYIDKEWEDDEINIEFSLKVRAIAANTKVREDAGKAAITYGPVVYCLEGVDNGNALHELLLDPSSVKNAKIIDAEIENNRTKMILLSGKRRKEDSLEAGEQGLYSEYKTPEYENITLKYIPYFMWANRGENNMQVWTRVM